MHFNAARLLALFDRNPPVFDAMAIAQELSIDFADRVTALVVRADGCCGSKELVEQEGREGHFLKLDVSFPSWRGEDVPASGRERR